MVSLVQRERTLLAEVLWRLKEIDRRKLYSDQKCGSLFEYCVKVLKYSEGQASRRVTACRLLKELPELASDIKNGSLNLTQLNQAKHFFNEMGVHTALEKKKVLDEIKGKTTKDTEKILWQKKGNNLPQKVQVSLKRETIEILQKLQGLKAHSCSDLDSLIQSMAKIAYKEWDPVSVKKKRVPGLGQTRYVQVGVKAEIWKRDEGKCRNCGSHFALQIDHVHPFSHGGKTVKENLRLLCRNCNQRKGNSNPAALLNISG